MEDLFTVGLSLILTFGVMTAWIEEDTWAVYVLYALVFGLGGVWALSCLVRQKPIFFNVPAILLWVVACWCGVQLLFGLTVNRWETMNAALMWTANAVLYLVALQLFLTASRRERFLRWLLYGGVALAIEAVLQLYTADRKIFWVFDAHDPHRIIMGPVPYHNHFAAIIALVLPIGVYFALLSSRGLLHYGWMVGLLVGAVFASLSRSGAALVGLELIALIFFFGKRYSMRARLARSGIILLLVAVWGAVAGWEGLWARLQNLDDSRLAAYRMSIEMIRHRPLLGYGAGTWPTVSPMFARSDDGLLWNQGHNDWLQWAAEGGIAFAALLTCLAASISIPAFRSGWGIGIPAVFLLCNVDFPLQKPVVSVLLFALAGVASTEGCAGAHWLLSCIRCGTSTDRGEA